jgi:hypothetical protein
MRSNILNKNLILDFGVHERSVEIEIEIKYYKTTYGEDADGNRGIPFLELDDYTIDIANFCLDGIALNDYDKSEVYKKAFSLLMIDWECWTYED